MKRILAIFALALFLCSCAHRHNAEPRKIVRLDYALAQYSRLDSASRDALRDSLSAEIEAFFTVLGYPSPQDSELEWWSQSDVVGIFQPDIDGFYPDLDDVEKSLGEILWRAHRDSLTIGATHFAAVAWGKPQPILIVDSVALIALNHYLGADYPGYSHMPAYRASEKNPKNLIYDLAAALAANGRPMDTADDPTVLNALLYEGALMQARMTLVPDAEITDAMGWRSDQLEIVEDNLTQIKQEMARSRMLYDTDPDLLNRLFSASPNTPFLGGTTPGRIGRYVGYDMVRRYMRRHPDARLSFLLSPAFYDNADVLMEIGFVE